METFRSLDHVFNSIIEEGYLPLLSNTTFFDCVLCYRIILLDPSGLPSDIRLYQEMDNGELVLLN